MIIKEVLKDSKRYFIIVLYVWMGRVLGYSFGAVLNLKSKRENKIMMNWIYVGATSGFVLVVVGFLLALLDNRQFFIPVLAKNMALKNETDAMKMWETAPFPVLFKVYFWNVSNPEEVSEGGKPKLVEVGPYVYEQWREKVNVRAEDNDTLSYNPTAKMIFNKKLSGSLKESDIVTILHLPVVSIVLQVHSVMPDYLSYLEQVWSALFPDMRDIFLSGSVRDLLFEGIPIDCSSKDFMVTTVCTNLEDNLPKTIRKVGSKEFRFSFFHYKTQVDSSVVRIYRGNSDIRKLGEIFSYNGEISMKKWKDRYCDMLNGTDGSHFPVGLSPQDFIYLFEPDLCRSLQAKFEKVVYKDEVKLFRFVNTPDLFASPDENPNNECYCVPKADLEDFVGGSDSGNETNTEKVPPKTCLKSGAVLLTPCLGVPIVATFPHFYMGDPTFLEYVNLSPRKELHETFVDVEPLSGVPFAGSKRIQFNVEVMPIREVAFMSELSSGLFPVLWLEEAMELKEEYYKDLVTLITVADWITKVGFVTVGVGIIALLSAGFFYSKRTKIRSQEPKTGSEEKPEYNGIYSNSSKLSGDIAYDPLNINSLRYNYRVPMSRNTKIFPNADNIAENFM